MNKHRLIYLALLFSMSVAALNTYSLLEVNFFLKAYSLLLILQAGFAIIYLGRGVLRR